MAHFAYSPDDDDPESNFIGIVAIEYEDGKPVEKHSHPKGHWSVVCHGTIEYTVGDRIFDVSWPGMVWIPKNTPHSMMAKTTDARSMCIMHGQEI